MLYMCLLKRKNEPPPTLTYLSNLAAGSSDMPTCGPQNLQRGTQQLVVGVLGLQAPGPGRPPQEDDPSGHHPYCHSGLTLALRNPQIMCQLKGT